MSEESDSVARQMKAEINLKIISALEAQDSTLPAMRNLADRARRCGTAHCWGFVSMLDKHETYDPASAFMPFDEDGLPIDNGRMPESFDPVERASAPLRALIRYSRLMAKVSLEEGYEAPALECDPSSYREDIHAQWASAPMPRPIAKRRSFSALSPIAPAFDDDSDAMLAPTKVATPRTTSAPPAATHLRSHRRSGKEVPILCAPTPRRRSPAHANFKSFLMRWFRSTRRPNTTGSLCSPGMTSFGIAQSIYDPVGAFDGPASDEALAPIPRPCPRVRFAKQNELILYEWQAVSNDVATWCLNPSDVDDSDCDPDFDDVPSQEVLDPTTSP
ncbi:hypothetical protein CAUPRSCDRAFT_12568 [Caulochytrium protostelioides]|nr:hypothetical protein CAUPRSCDRAFT_12568 [Caulochytrium protostelioides]